MKKVLSVLLFVSLIIGAFALNVPAAEIGDNLIRNGDFEKVNANNIGVTSWKASGNRWNYDIGGVSVVNDEVHSGKTAIRLKNTDEIKDSHVTQKVKLIPGATYKASVWVNIKKTDGATFLFSMAFYNKSYVNDGSYTQAYRNPKMNRWVEFVHEFKALEQPIGEVDFRVRLYNGVGEVYIDDVALELVKMPDKIIEDEPIPEPIEVIPPFEFKQPAEGESELLVNTGFEEVNSDGSIVGWTPNGFKWNEETGCSSVQKPVRSGKWAAKITNDLEVSDGHLTQKVKFVPGAIYQASVWVNIEDLGRGKIIYSCAYWANNYTKYIGGFQPAQFKYVNRRGEWVQYISHFIAQDMGDNEVEFRLRVMGGDGIVYFDDASLYMIEHPPKINFFTNEVFYYTESKEGFATAALNLDQYPEITGSTVDFFVKDGNKIIDSKLNASTEGDNIARYIFNLEDLEIQKEYTVETVLKDKDGKVLETQTETIQRFMPRPKALTEEGYYKNQVRGKDGKLTDELDADGNPVLLDVMLAYTRPENDEELKYFLDQGVTAFIQGSRGEIERDNIGAALDVAESLGLKAVVGLYPDMKPAGYPTSVDRTTYYVETYKDHPAVLGWAVLDEPSAYFKFWELEQLMKDSYKLIRSLDPVHPVYAVEATTDFLPLVGRYVDILASDPYPYAGYPVSGRGATYLRAAAEAVSFGKPTCSIIQTFESSGYFPTAMEARHFWYEALFEGSTMLGYYSFRLARANSVPLNKTEIWDDLVEWGTGWEQEEAFKHFVYREYPVFNESTVIGDEAWYSSYVKDGNIYIIILNMDEENRNAKARTVEIPLKSDGGIVELSGFTAELIAGEGTKTIQGEGSTFTVPLAENAALVYKITPKGNVDFSKLKTSNFRDLGRYSWAAEQIRELESRGIVEGMTAISYRPGYRITRGDFAMNLVRTLGLTANSTENFDDVSPNARYAKEIAIGKALGILKGAGDGKFNPEAEISRQDMMVICARGMRLASKLSETGSIEDLAEFSDGESIADYAVEDVAAMVKEGIVKGNADGTINPYGNATRAESAVIMYRILEK